jgi:hypothetical protein
VLGRRAWNKGKFTGPKPPLRPGHVWLIRAKLQLERHSRDLALFNLAIEGTRGTHQCEARQDWFRAEAIGCVSRHERPKEARNVERDRCPKANLHAGHSTL